MIQLFLSYKGVSAQQVGLFNTVVSIVSVLGCVAFSSLSDQRSDIIRDHSRLLLSGSSTIPALFATGHGNEGGDGVSLYPDSWHIANDAELL